MNYFLFVLFIVGILSINAYYLANSKADLIELLVKSTGLFLVLLCFLSIVFLLLGSFRPGLIIIIGSLFPLLRLIVSVVQKKIKLEALNVDCKLNYSIAAVLLLIVLMLPFVFARYEYIEYTGDAGVYSASAIDYAKHGKLKMDLEVKQQLSEELKPTYNADNLEWFNSETKQGSYLPGTYIDNKNEMMFYYQFYPSWPLLMACWGSIFGVENQHYVMILLYVLIIFLLFYIFKYFKVTVYKSLIGVLVMATSPVLIHFTKYPTSELFLLFLILFTVYLLQQNGFKDLVCAGFSISLFCLSHISSFMYMPLLLMVIPFIYFHEKHELSVFLIISLIGFIVSVPYGYFVSRQYFIDIYGSSFAKFFSNHSLNWGVFIVIALALSGILLLIGALKKYMDSSKVIRGDF